MHAAKQDRGEIARKYIRMRLREARWVAQRKKYASLIALSKIPATERMQSARLVSRICN